ncbi:archaeosortase A [Halobacterium litoreum]|uniref:Archaeosortase A n=1 Tax=Halobacterium litoreum TaxID=2039234 RepID=A0ABD5NG12_9EURY|nr:archaeosortase A [Halobacterium litoreum]UHH12973.1 archaeosortase A [Halobacterium litoreum]
MTAVTDALAWFVVGAFGTSALLQGQSRQWSRYLAVTAWVLFAAFWGLLTPHFAFTQQSIIEGVLAAAAVPACLYTAYLVGAGKRNPETLTRAVAIMGLLYLPFQTIEVLRQFMIETVAQQGEWVMAQLGYYPPIVDGDHGYHAKYVFLGENQVTGEAGHRFTTTVLLACTGVGSMSIVGGLALAVDAPLRRRLLAVAITFPIIYGLNIVRVVFIAIAHGEQWFAGGVVESLVDMMFGSPSPNMVSYLFADRVLAQSLSVVVLVVLTLALLRIIPELGGVIEDVLYIATGKEYDVTARFAQ